MQLMRSRMMTSVSRLFVLAEELSEAIMHEATQRASAAQEPCEESFQGKQSVRS